MQDLFVERRLFTPGPTPAPECVKVKYLETSTYHRSPEFEAVFKETTLLLKKLFNSSTTPIVLTSSGTGALEAALVNLTSPNDEVVVISCGKFGQRWHKLATAYRCKVHLVESSLESQLDLNSLKEVLTKSPFIKAVFLQAHETSTGMLLPVEEISKCVKEISPNALIIVDAVSSLGAHGLDVSGWGLDCAISGSQKGFGVAPGLAFLALSERAWLRQSETLRPKFYFDLAKERQGQSSGRSSYTPAISLVLGLHAALVEIDRIGFAEFVNHHVRMGQAARAAFQAMNLEFFLPEAVRSNVLTTIIVPKGIDGGAVLRHAKESYGAVISGGQDELKGKIIRFSHLGFVSQFHLLQGVIALEYSLRHFGHTFELGAGVSAAMKSLLK